MATMTKTQFAAWRKAAGKPALTAAQLAGRYKVYTQRMAGSKPKSAAVNNRPDGWGNEGFQVTASNRSKYPIANYEIVEGQAGTKWARPRTELTGIDPELQGLVKTYDTETGKQTAGVRSVYDALAGRLTSEAQASQARLGGLADLAGRSVPGVAFQSGAVTNPDGSQSVASGAPATAGVDSDLAATQQRMLLRNAALDVNTANLDAQQAPQLGARAVASLTGQRTTGRSDLIQKLVLQSRADALEAQKNKMDFLASQMSTEQDAKNLSSQLASKEKIAGIQAQTSENNNYRNNQTKILQQQQKAAAAAAKKKAAAAKPKYDTAAYNRLRNQWIGKAKGYMPAMVQDKTGAWVVDKNVNNILSGTLGSTVNSEGNRVAGQMTLDQFYNQGVQAGVRPSDMVKMLMSAGVNLSRSDIYNLLLRALPEKNARAVAKQITGYDVPTAYGG